MSVLLFWEIVAVVVLVAVAGFSACADAALSRVSRVRAAELVEQGVPRAARLKQLVDDPARVLNLVLLLRVACEIAATVLVTVLFMRRIDDAWGAGFAAIGVMIAVSYIFIGVMPRTIGRQHSVRVALRCAGPLALLTSVLGPLAQLLIVIGNAVTPGRGFREGPFSTEVELRELVDLAGERGVVDEDEREMIHSVFELGDTIAREVMVPRTEIIWIEQAKSVRQALALSLRTGYSRLPVIGESVDDVVGVVNIKDLARASVEGGGQTVKDLMRPASFVPDTKRLDDLLRQMQLTHNHLAIAVDEYGGTAGLLTIEDILEEIVGEITDEYDQDERPPVEQVDADTFRVSARLGVEDLAELFGVELDDSDVETVGGLLAQRLGRVPLPGAEAEIAGLWLKAEGGKDNRGRVRITTVVVRRGERERNGERV